MDISVIIINWNSKAYVRQCLRSLAANSDGLKLEVIVVDNASGDGCGEMLAAEFPEARFIQSKKNLGFSGGNNMAAEAAAAPVLLFLNPDTEVRPGALRRLLEALKSQPRAGAVGARLLNSDGTLQTSCIQAFPSVLGHLLDANLFRSLSPRARLWGTAPLYSNAAQPSEIEGISGACILTRHEVFKQVHGFSEDYFMYYEDMDYCLKVQKAGWRNYYVPDAEVVHHGGKSSASAQSAFSCVMMAESGRRFFQKEGGSRAAGMFRLTMAAKAMMRLCVLSPVYLLAWPLSRQASVAASFRKWASVFRWAFGAEQWAADYQQTRAVQ
jgi:GT2 family glycosyltransferase